jgi:broad specificity phosphatase PhoE
VDASPLGIVTHGGQIKVILSRYVYPKRNFSSWKVKNGGAYLLDFDLKNKKASVLSMT